MPQQAGAQVGISSVTASSTDDDSAVQQKSGFNWGSLIGGVCFMLLGLWMIGDTRASGSSQGGGTTLFWNPQTGLFLVIMGVIFLYQFLLPLTKNQK
ncbi:MAG TPA: hypothetical protein PLS70_10555 [Acidobacteriota bacterium]|nr:hypothetical protein [Acidobacteriota bacterium]